MFKKKMILVYASCLITISGSPRIIPGRVFKTKTEHNRKYMNKWRLEFQNDAQNQSSQLVWQQLFHLTRSDTVNGKHHEYPWTVCRLLWILIDKKEGILKTYMFWTISFGFFKIAGPGSENKTQGFIYNLIVLAHGGTWSACEAITISKIFEICLNGSSSIFGARLSQHFPKVNFQNFEIWT